MLRDAPHPVRRAWQEDWTDITNYPDAGWYGERPIEFPMGNVHILTTNWKRICGPNGEEPYYVRKAPEEQPTTGSCDFEIEIGTGRFRVG